MIMPARSTSTSPTRADRWSASCALSTTTRTARRSTTGSALPGGAAAQRPSPRAREDPSSTSAPAHDPARTKSRRVQVPFRSMAMPPPLTKCAALAGGTRLLPKCRLPPAAQEALEALGGPEPMRQTRTMSGNRRRLGIEPASWGGRTRTSNFPVNSRAVCQLTYTPLHRNRPIPPLPRHTRRTAVRRQTHRRKVVNRGEGPGKLTPPEPLGAGGAFTNLPRRYAARPPEFEFRLRLRFDPRTANVITRLHYCRTEPLARDPMPPVIAPATTSDLPAIFDLLDQSKLPRAGLDQHLGTTLVAKESKQVVGSAALELYGSAALLRSVAVAAEWRGRGLGQTLTAAALDLAQRRGVHTVYLLTETAAQFFPKFGFRSIARSEGDKAVLGSTEFTTACPQTALVMARALP